MTANRIVGAGALALASLACAHPQGGTDTADPQAPATTAGMPREDPAAQETPLSPPAAEGVIETVETDADAWDDLEAALSTLDTPVPTAPATQPWASDASNEAMDVSQDAPPLPEEPDYRREEELLKATGAAYRVQLRALESRVQLAEQAVGSAETELSEARKGPKLMVGEPVPIIGFLPGSDVEIEPAPPAPDRATVIAAAEQRLAQAREELKRARDAEDDLLTKIRRERIPLGYVL